MVYLTHDNKTTINNNAIIGLVKNWLNIFQKSIIVTFDIIEWIFIGQMS